MSGARRTAAAAAVLAAGCLSKPGFECPLEPGPRRFIEAQIGMNGGSDDDVSDCGARWVVGAAFTMNRNSTGQGNERVVVKISLRCATLTQRGDDHTTGAIEDAPLIGGDDTTVDGPFVADCDDGQVVVGLTAHIVDSSGGLFNSVALQCSGLGLDGMPSGDVLRVPVTRTGVVPADDEAHCGAGEALHGVGTRSGSLLDQLKLSCAPMACVLPPS